MGDVDEGERLHRALEHLELELCVVASKVGAELRLALSCGLLGRLGDESDLCLLPMEVVEKIGRCLTTSATVRETFCFCVSPFQLPRQTLEKPEKDARFSGAGTYSLLLKYVLRHCDVASWT